MKNYLLLIFAVGCGVSSVVYSSREQGDLSKQNQQKVSVIWRDSEGDERRVSVSCDPLSVTLMAFQRGLQKRTGVFSQNQELRIEEVVYIGNARFQQIDSACCDDCLRKAVCDGRSTITLKKVEQPEIQFSKRRKLLIPR